MPLLCRHYREDQGSFMTGWHFHLRGGDDLQAPLAESGLGGFHAALTDPLVQGRLPPGPLPDYIAGRADYMAGAYGQDRDAIYDRLVAEYLQLDRIDGPVRALFWAEADLYDQLLLRVLERLGEKAVGRLWVVQGPLNPGFTVRSPAALAAMAEAARPATAAMVIMARDAWAAMVTESADRLALLAQIEMPDWPELAPVLARRLRDLPWRDSGLTLTERLALVAVLNGAATAPEVFMSVSAAEPAPFLTEPMIRPVLARLVIDGLIWRQAERFTLTELGRRVVSGSAKCSPAAAAWLWDDAAGRPVPAHEPAGKSADAPTRFGQAQGMVTLPPTIAPSGQVAATPP